MEQTKQNTEMSQIQLNHEFYYTLARMQFEAIKYVARGKNDDDKCKREKSVIEQLQKIIKQCEDDNEQPPPPPCLPPCKWDALQSWCNCPHKKVVDTDVGPLDGKVTTQK